MKTLKSTPDELNEDGTRTFAEIASLAGIKPPRLAAKFGIPRRTAEQWVTGERTPPDYVLRMIETILDYEEKNKEAVD